MASPTKEEKQILLDISKEQIKEEQQWFQNIVIMSSGLLGLLVALHTDKSPTETLHWMFIIILSTLVLGILIGVIFLSFLPRSLNILRKEYAARIFEGIHGSSDTVVSNYKPFERMKWASLFLFAISILTLVCYAILLDS